MSAWPLRIVLGIVLTLIFIRTWGRPEKVVIKTSPAPVSNHDSNQNQDERISLSPEVQKPSVYYSKPYGIAYTPHAPGPSPVSPHYLPVSKGALTATSEDYHHVARPLVSAHHFRPYGPNVVHEATVPFFGSADAYAPFPEVQTRWEKAGIVTTLDQNDDEIMNLYRRPIAPLRDLWEYSVQDRDGIVIPLEGVAYLEDGDRLTIRGKEKKGKWVANIFIKNKYIWV